MLAIYRTIQIVWYSRRALRAYERFAGLETTPSCVHPIITAAGMAEEARVFNHCMGELERLGAWPEIAAFHPVRRL